MDRVGQEHEVAVDVGVDEAGDDVPTGRVEDLRGLDPVEPADVGDHRFQQGHVGPIRRPAGAVDHPATFDDQVECHESTSSSFSDWGIDDLNGPSACVAATGPLPRP